jgi:YggT family protein
MGYIIYFVNAVIEIVILVVIVYVILGYLIPDNRQPVRAFLARIVEPLLSPIRRLIPQTGAFDFSPVILIIILILLQSLIGVVF